MSEESKLIDAFIRQWGSAAQGIGDDAAILDVPSGEKLVVSTDAAVENVHFIRDVIPPKQIGYRSAAAALSDIAAMAARPLGLLFALVLPDGWRDVAVSIADGVGDAAAASGCAVIGGNISNGTELSITTTVLGASPKPLTRAGARAGDSLYVTGYLGGAAAAVRAWRAGREPDLRQVLRFSFPFPRISEALWLASQGATSAIDLSDGLATDAAHLAESSGVAITINADLVPRFPGTLPEEALSGGEDYELLVTAPAIDPDLFRKEFNASLTCIGSVSDGPASLEFTKDGKRFTPPPGFDHLSRQ